MTRNEKIVIMDAIAALNDLYNAVDDLDGETDFQFVVRFQARRLQRLVDDFDDYIESLKRKVDKNA